MKVLVYIDRMNLQGGLQRVVSNLLAEWVRLGWETHLVIESEGRDAFPVPALTRRHALLSAPKRRGFLGLLDNLRIVFGLRRILRREGFAAAIAMSPVANVHLAMAGDGGSAKLIGSQYDYAPHHPVSAWKRWLMRRYYPRLDRFVCATREAAELGAADFPGTRTMAIPNWLTPPSALAGASALEARWMRPGRKLFCACGRFNVLKGFRELLEVFAEIKDELPEWDLMLVGDGEDRELLPQMVERLGLRGRVHFPGWVSHPGDFFAASDVFVFPSRSEGFGLVLMEAMACGLPCVAYNCKVGPSEQVGHETDGLLIPDGDRVAFKAAMVRLARDHALRRRFSVEARRAIRRFEAAAVQPMWEDLLCRR